MGNLLEGEEEVYSSYEPSKNTIYRLQQQTKISQEEEEKLVHLLKSRRQKKSLYLLSPISYKVADPQEFESGMMCQQFKNLTIIYDSFDHYLSELSKDFPLPQSEVQQIIFSVTQALTFMYEQLGRIHHGDINPKMICKKGTSWKLIDNSFIRQGISAYEKVLLGEDGFISPSQMDKIRFGFVRESPALKQEDDIFALGMTCMEVMSARPSRFCYKETYIRFNEKQIQERIVSMTKKYDPALVGLVRKMMNFEEKARPSLKDILNHPSISRYGKKTSLKNYAHMSLPSTMYASSR